MAANANSLVEKKKSVMYRIQICHPIFAANISYFLPIFLLSVLSDKGDVLFENLIGGIFALAL